MMQYLSEFRSPSCMAISRSYSCHLDNFLEKQIFTQFFLHLFYQKRCNFFPFISFFVRFSLPLFRSAFRMPTSRSYPRHFVKKRRKKHLKYFFSLPFFFLDRHPVWRSLDPTLDIWSNFVKEKKALNVLFSFHLLCCISSNVARVPKGSQRFPKVTKISPLFSFVLPILTDHYIKSSDGGLQCE